jgi:hypothetical protein
VRRRDCRAFAATSKAKLEEIVVHGIEICTKEDSSLRREVFAARLETILCCPSVLVQPVKQL